jgi:hypothetical protein
MIFSYEELMPVVDRMAKKTQALFATGSATCTKLYLSIHTRNKRKKAQRYINIKYGIDSIG